MIAHVHGQLRGTEGERIVKAIDVGSCGHDLVVDFTAVTFLDSNALRVLIVTVQRRSIRMVAPVANRPHRTLAIAGLTDVVPTFETVDAALMLAHA